MGRKGGVNKATINHRGGDGEGSRCPAGYS